jgi:hypothetical protein
METTERYQEGSMAVKVVVFLEYWRWEGEESLREVTLSL